MDLLVSEDVCC